MWVRDELHRRVVAVSGKRVCYSIGSDHNHWCNLRTFREWMAKAVPYTEGA